MKKFAIGFGIALVLGYGTKKALGAFIRTKSGDDLMYAISVGAQAFMDELDESQKIRAVDDTWARRDARFDAFMKAHPNREQKR